MNQVAKFEKVSYEQFKKDVMETRDSQLLHQVSDAYGRVIDDKLKKLYDEIKLPVRATSGSAGYDFFSPFDLRFSYETRIPTGIRCKIDDGWFLGILPRSGFGFKTGIRLANTMGVIDSDYYYSDNEGHIFIKFVNKLMDGGYFIFHEIKRGKGFAQGIFLPYGITYDDNCEEIRNGGMGSTDK